MKERSAVRYTALWLPRFLVLSCWVVVAAACQQPSDSVPAPASSQTPLSSNEAAPAVEFELLERASLVVVTLDTTRADHLEPYASGNQRLETPHLQNIAEQGVVFEQAWATAPVTLPTHASLFTGLNPPQHGVRNNGIHYLSSETPVLADILRQHAFRTAAFVSAAVLDHRYGLDRGFDHYDDDLSSGGPKRLRLNAERSAAQTVAAAGRWLDQVMPGERFFLWVHLFDPHAPYDPPTPWAQRFQDRPYAGEIAAVDAALGTLLEHPQLAERRDYLLVVVGDHGESLGSHGESTHAMLAYDATLRIPWLMRLPAGGDGLRLGQPVSQIDLLPTALDLLLPESSDVLPDVDGLSLRRVLNEGIDGRLTERSLYGESLVPFYTYGWAPLRVLRQGDFKYIEAPTPELYNLARDQDELENLMVSAEAERWASQAAELRQALQSVETGLPSREASLVVDAEMTAKLRSLGYLGSRVAPERSTRPDPKVVIALHGDLEKAQHLFLRQEFVAAIEILQRVLRQDGDNLIALSTLAKSLAAVDEGDKASQLAQRAVRLDPDNPDLLVTSGLIELSRDLPEVALNAFEAALVLDPRWVDAVLGKAQVLFQLQRQEEATSILAALLAEDPHHGRAQVMKAEWVQLPAGQLQEAISQLQEVVERRPDLAEARRALGRVLEADGDLAQALEIYRKGVETLPKDGPLQARLGVLLARLGQWEAAKGPLQRAVELGQGVSPTVQFALASIAQRDHNWPEVERLARRAVALDAKMSSAWNLLAAALEEQQRLEDALKAYRQAVVSDAANWQARYNESVLLTRLQRYAAARDGFESVLLQQPHHGKTHFQLGALYAGALGDMVRARRHFEASLAAEKDPKAAAQTRRLLAQLPSG